MCTELYAISWRLVIWHYLLRLHTTSGCCKGDTEMYWNKMRASDCCKYRWNYNILIRIETWCTPRYHFFINFIPDLIFQEQNIPFSFFFFLIFPKKLPTAIFILVIRCSLGIFKRSIINVHVIFLINLRKNVFHVIKYKVLKVVELLFFIFAYHTILLHRVTLN